MYKVSEMRFDFENLRVKRWTILVFLGLILLGATSYGPTYVLILEDFDKRTTSPFIEAAEFLNSTGFGDGVFTSSPDLLARYYKGPVYRLPMDGGFERILDDARKNGIRYAIVDSGSFHSPELEHLYLYSAGYRWHKSYIPSELVLVQTQPWRY